MTRATLTILTAALFYPVTPVLAAPIRYTLTTKATGTLGAASFTNTQVTATVTGDTSGVTPGPAPYEDVLVNSGVASVTVAGLGTATFTNQIVIVSSLKNTTLLGTDSAVLILDNTSNTGILVQAGSAFSTYDLRSPLGSVSGTGGVASGSRITPVFPTTAGNLTWAVGQPLGTSTFTASAPPPSGAFGFLVTASYNDPTQGNGRAILGLMNFDGGGKVIGTYTSEPDTQPDHTNAGTLTGTYSTNPDNTGSVTITLDMGTSLTFAMAITDNGQTLQLAATNCTGDCEIGGNSTMGGVAKAAYAGPPKGSYGYRNGISPKPSSGVGIVNFDDAGNVTQSGTGVFLTGTKGQPDIFTLGGQPGTYSLNPDGTGTINFPKTADNNAQTFAFVLADNGSELLFVQTRRSGSGVSFGTARLQ